MLGAGGAGGSYGGGATCEFGEGTSSGCTKGTAYAYSGGGGGGGRLKDGYAYIKNEEICFELIEVLTEVLSFGLQFSKI